LEVGWELASSNRNERVMETVVAGLLLLLFVGLLVGG